MSTSLRLNIKHSQEKCNQRMLNASNKQFKPAEIGDNIIIPISKPDKLSRIGPRNIVGCITNQVKNIYSVGTSEGESSVGYTRNQFPISSANICLPRRQRSV